MPLYDQTIKLTWREAKVYNGMSGMHYWNPLTIFIYNFDASNDIMTLT